MKFSFGLRFDFGLLIPVINLNAYGKGEMEAEDFSVEILQDILKKGGLDYRSIVEAIHLMAQSTSSQFFTVISNALVMCKFSTSEAFKEQTHYSQEDIPLDRIIIWHGTRQIAMICISDQDVWEEYPEQLRLRIQNVIAIGLIVEDLKESRYQLIFSVCQSLVRFVTKALSIVSKMTTNQSVAQVNQILSEMITSIYDTLDYIKIESEKMTLEQNLVTVSSFVAETIGIIQSDMPNKIEFDIDSNVPEKLMFDMEKVRQMLFRALKSIRSVPSLVVYVTQPSYSTPTRSYLNFRLVSNLNKFNAEIERKFKNDAVTSDNLGVIIVQKLCAFMAGGLSIDEYGVNRTGVSLTIRCYPSNAYQNLTDKRILLGIADDSISREIMNTLSSFGAFPVWMESPAAMEQYLSSVGRYQLVILDSTFSAFAEKSVSKGIPVLWVRMSSVENSRTQTMARYASGSVEVPLEQGEVVQAVSGIFS